MALSVAFASAALACSSPSSPTPPGDAAKVAVVGTVDGAAFTGKTAVGFVNAAGDAGGIHHQTIVIFDGPATCDTYSDLLRQQRYVMVAFTSGAGTTFDATQAPGAGSLSFFDYTVQPPHYVEATAGTATLVSEAKSSSVLDPDAGFAPTHGHVKLDFTNGAEHVSGEADYLLCF